MNASTLILLGVALSLALGGSLVVAACWPQRAPAKSPRPTSAGSGHGKSGHGKSGHGDSGHGDSGHGDSGEGYWSRGRTGRIVLAGIGFLLLNSWWLALAALVFVKFVILREDT